MKAKPEKLWAVVEPGGNIQYYGLNKTKEGAILHFLGWPCAALKKVAREKWERCESDGYRVTLVIVKEIEA